MPTGKDAPVQLEDIQLIPGTKSLWAAGGALPVGVGNAEAVILKYGN
ncbi:MAG: hypothetical protein JWM19_3508 [Actinomycetia bacterium]|nr:hypothetical protein [Actinomycetes bacterium]